jgi:AcrR family transcriptional regulator
VTRTFRRLDRERQIQVVAAIFDEAVESGPQDLNIKRVAARAGVSIGSLYQYFESRQGLLDFTIELVVRVVTAQFESYRAPLASLPLAEALQAYAQGGLEYISGPAAGFSRFFARAAYGGDPDLLERVVRPISEEMLAIVTDLLSAAQERGELRPGLDLPAVARSLHVLTIALLDPIFLPYLNSYFQVYAPDFPAERTYAAALHMMLAGIANPAQ